MPTYTFTAKTADVDNAGTDATFRINLIGRNGQSGLRNLFDLPGNDQERGAKPDSWSYTDIPDLGEIVAVGIHLPLGQVGGVGGEMVELPRLDKNAAWQPEWVEVSDGTHKWRAEFDVMLNRGPEYRAVR